MPKISDRMRQQGEIADKSTPGPLLPTPPKPVYAKQVRVKKADVPTMVGPPPACDECRGERHPDHPVYQVIKYEPRSRRWLCASCDPRVLV